VYLIQRFKIVVMHLLWFWDCFSICFLLKTQVFFATTAILMPFDDTDSNGNTAQVAGNTFRTPKHLYLCRIWYHLGLNNRLELFIRPFYFINQKYFLKKLTYHTFHGIRNLNSRIGLIVDKNMKWIFTWIMWVPKNTL
jgi:hypothetical protein